MRVHVRHIMTVAALIAIAGCSGAATPPPGSQGASAVTSVVHRGVPFIPFIHRGTAPQRSVQAAYSTKKSLVFESDQDEAAVNIYATAKLSSNPAPIGMIHVSVGCPYGLAIDKKGTIYVADNCGGNDVELYPKGSTTMKSSITDGIANPLGLAIDKKGTLFVSNYPASITEYAYGTSTPKLTITGEGLTDPFGLAVDKKGNLYIADSGAGAVFELPAGSSSITNLNLSGLGEPVGLGIDPKTGYLWETGGADDIINVYDLSKGRSPIETIAGNGFPYAISDEQEGKPKGEVVTSDIESHDVYAFKPGKYTPYATLTNGVELPTGLLITKP
jgi:DNA-binding beta-propeller fold protein YncE